jgi:hypothetical protein
VVRSVDRRIYNNCQIVDAAGDLNAGGNLTVAGHVERGFGDGTGL